MLIKLSFNCVVRAAQIAARNFRSARGSGRLKPRQILEREPKHGPTEIWHLLVTSASEPLVEGMYDVA